MGYLSSLHKTPILSRPFNDTAPFAQRSAKISACFIVRNSEKGNTTRYNERREQVIHAVAWRNAAGRLDEVS